MLSTVLSQSAVRFLVGSGEISGGGVCAERDRSQTQGIAGIAANVGAAHQLAVLKADKSALVKARGAGINIYYFSIF